MADLEGVEGAVGAAGVAVAVARAAPGRAPQLALLAAPTGAAAEQYRLLAQRIEPHLARGARRIGVTSASRREGRTTTAINLALALARARRHHVLLVDADLRAPSVHAALGLPALAGLVDVTAGRADLEQALVRLGDETVDVLAAGVAGAPATALAAPALHALLGDLGRRYGAVVVDAPPVLPLADVPTLAAALDGLLVVVRAGRTRRELLKLA